MWKKSIIGILFSLLISGIFMIAVYYIYQLNDEKAEAVSDNVSPTAPSVEREVKIAKKVLPLKTTTITVPKSKLLDVPLIKQMDAPRIYNGCEVTSLAMILNFYGFNITKNELASNLKSVPLTYENGLIGNPHDGFVGDVTGAKPGYGVYHKPIVDLAEKYVDKTKVKDISGSNFEQVISTVGEGRPVWVITTSTFASVDNMETWTTPAGKVKISFSEHSVVNTGYDEIYIYLHNRYDQKNQKVNREKFIQSWEKIGKQAIHFLGMQGQTLRPKVE